MNQLGTITIQAPVEPLLDFVEVCRIVGRSDKLVKSWIDAGNFPPSVNIGGKKMWTNYAIGVWLAWVQVCPNRAVEAEETEPPVKGK